MTKTSRAYPSIHYTQNTWLVWSILLLLVLPCGMKAQQNWQQLAQIDISATAMFTDKLGQIYLLDAKNVLDKYSPEGKLLFRFNNNNLGKIKHVDPSNPLNTLLFVPDYQQVIILDRTLNPQHTLRLNDLGYDQVQALCMSNQNSLWLYDITNFKLLNITGDGTLLREGQDLSLVLGPSSRFNPRQLRELDNQLYANDPNIGVLLFDNFGTYLKTLYIPGIQTFEVQGTQLIYQLKGFWYSFDMRSFETKPIPLPANIEPGSVQQISIQNGKLYLRFEHGVEVWALN
jgi:hypothetical protein